MKSEFWRLPDGVDELRPPRAWELELIRRKVLDTFRNWGFDYIEPPLIEYLDALLVAGGRDLDLQTLKAVDQRSGRLLGVRADLTSQAARIDASRLGDQGVSKLCYAGPVVHANPQSLMDSRVPIKAGAEIFGSAALETDAEVIALMVEVLQAAVGGRPKASKHRCPIANCTTVFQKNGRGGWDGHVASLKNHPEWHPEVKDPQARKECFKAEYPEWFKDPAPKAGKHRCPIANCTTVFQKNGRGGWDSHVASLKNHPEWHPEVKDPQARKERFKAEYPEWFKDPAPVVVLGNMGIYRALTRPLGLDEDSEHSLFAAVQCKSENDIRALVDSGGLADLLVALPRLMGHIEDLDGACLELRGAPAEVGRELARLQRFVGLVMDCCTSVDLRFDLAELAGYGYHNGPVFAAFHGGHGQALARGGRYDGIGATFGRARPATGFDVNLKRLLNGGPPPPDRLPADWFRK